MFKTLGCLLTFILSVVLAVIVGAGIVLNRMFGIFRRKNFSNNADNRSQNQTQEETNQYESTPQNDGKHRLFDDAEGEYVDYEEIEKK